MRHKVSPTRNIQNLCARIMNIARTKGPWQRTIDSKGSKRRGRGLSNIQPRITMKLGKSDGIRLTGSFQITISLTELQRVQFAGLDQTLLDTFTAGQLTIVEPTATLMLSVRRSFRETLMAVMHSSHSSEATSRYSTKHVPAIQFIVGSRMRAIHSLLMLPDSLSINSTRDSALTATS